VPEQYSITGWPVLTVFRAVVCRFPVVSFTQPDERRAIAESS
jgi:hypothetical protein